MKLHVEGMTCAHCERAITRAIATLGGTARVDVAQGTVEVEGIRDASAVRAAIENEGYRVAETPAGGARDGGCCCGPRAA